MYLRTTRQRRKHGPDAIYYQLAENYYHKTRRRSETRVIYTFGRADQVDPEALRRLAQSLLRVANDERIDLSARVFPPDVGIDDIEQVSAYGVLYAARALWEELGIGPLLRGKMQQTGCNAPHDMALLAMTAHRLARPGSKLACYEQWLADDVYWPEAHALALEHLYRALDFLLGHIEALEQEIFFRTADLFNADVDLIFWDTTTLYCEIDDEDEESEQWQTRMLPALRKRGHNKEGRDSHPQVVVGLALTRDGLPVRSWVFPGNTVDATTVAQVKESLRGWKLGRAIFVGDAGMDSEANRQALAKGLGHYILAMPVGKLTEVQEEVLGRPGRFRPVHASLEVKEVVVGEGERRRRYIVCRNVVEAARQRQHREEVLTALRQELARLDPQAPDHTKRACELVASKRYGRYLSRGPGGRLAIDAAAVRRAARMDGKYVLLTNDDTLSPEDVGLGYKAMMLLEACFRRMKTTGLRIRPVYHWTAHRITSHIKLCVLALLIERAAELRVGDTWRNLRLALEEVKAGRYRAHGPTIVQSTRLTAQVTAYLKKLGVKPPPRVLSIEKS